MTSAEKCSFRNKISVEKRCLRKNRAVRYERYAINMRTLRHVTSYLSSPSLPNEGGNG